MEGRITIKRFENLLAPHFAQLNKAWIQKYFTLEPLDEVMLNDPQQYIIAKNGHIFFAFYNNDVAGTFALLKTDDQTYELSKMAVAEKYQGLKIGHALLEAAIEQATQLGACKLVLYSNTVLQPALHLYYKFGFAEVPLAHSEYQRSNIKMEKHLTPNPSPKGEGNNALQEKFSEFHRGAPPKIFEFAKEQRKEGTTPEQILWHQLRNKKLDGLKFRRQHPIGPYIADFYCHEKALVIELDGAMHHLTENKEYDKVRDQYLRKKGLQVLRFSNNDIYKNLQVVLQKIKDFANSTNKNSNNCQTI